MMNTSDALNSLQGEWTVMAIGAAMPMNLLHDRKRITGRSGHNLIRGHAWGWFTVTGDGPELTLDYDDPRNPTCIRAVRDRIFLDDKGWAGSLYMRGRLQFYFRLTKVNHGGEP